MFRLIPLALLCAAGCATHPLDYRFDAISEAFANRAAIAKKCGIAEPDRSAVFLSEATKYADSASRVRLMGAAVRIIANAQTEEAEYICTPEMFEQSEAAAEKAQADWRDLQGGRP